MPGVKTVDFYFDPVSPYSWLAAMQLAELSEKTGARFRYVPVLFAGLLNAHGNKGPAEIAAKREYTFKDAMRSAMRQGLPFQGPPGHPFNPLKALRMCAAIEDDAERATFALRLLDACWSHGRDITDDQVLIELGGEAHLRRTGEQAVKDRVRENTDRAIALGIFGVPTFVVDGELFWGSDRVPFLADYLTGKLHVDEELYRAFLARPRAADRVAK